jgi:hypothetical protein
MGKTKTKRRDKFNESEKWTAAQRTNGRDLKNETVNPCATNGGEHRSDNVTELAAMGGDHGCDTETEFAPKTTSVGGETHVESERIVAAVAHISSALQELQRQRVVALKSRIMLENRLVATVATTMGYHTGLDEQDREKAFADARKLIVAVLTGESHDAPSYVVNLVIAGSDGMKGFTDLVGAYEDRMIEMAQQLPVALWVKHVDQRGFGFLFLAAVIGETGDLHNYPNPAKVWRRMGCAPFKGKMGATWKSGREGSLSADEWSEFGYSPRRRSLVYLIGENLMKQNANKKTGQVGPYRKVYDEEKLKAQNKHPDWPPQRCHRHAMLLASKQLLLHLWIEWRRIGR